MADGKQHFTDMVKKTRYQVNNSGESFASKFTSKRAKTEVSSDSSEGGTHEASQGDVDSAVKNKSKNAIDSIRKRRESDNKANSSLSEKIKRQRLDCLFLVRGYDGKRPAWHYVLVHKNLRTKFMDAAKSGSVNVKEYGDVLYSGWGKDPPQDMVDKVKEEFGA